MKPGLTTQDEMAVLQKPGPFGETAVRPLCGRGRVLGGGSLDVLMGAESRFLSSKNQQST